MAKSRKSTARTRPERPLGTAWSWPVAEFRLIEWRRVVVGCSRNYNALALFPVGHDPSSMYGFRDCSTEREETSSLGIASFPAKRSPCFPSRIYNYDAHASYLRIAVVSLAEDSFAGCFGATPNLGGATTLPADYLARSKKPLSARDIMNMSPAERKVWQDANSTSYGVGDYAKSMAKAGGQGALAGVDGFVDFIPLVDAKPFEAMGAYDSNKNSDLKVSQLIGSGARDAMLMVSTGGSYATMGGAHATVGRVAAAAEFGPSMMQVAIQGEKALSTGSLATGYLVKWASTMEHLKDRI